MSNIFNKLQLFQEEIHNHIFYCSFISSWWHQGKPA